MSSRYPFPKPLGRTVATDLSKVSRPHFLFKTPLPKENIVDVEDLPFPAISFPVPSPEPEKATEQQVAELVRLGFERLYAASMTAEHAQDTIEINQRVKDRLTKEVYFAVDGEVICKKR